MSPRTPDATELDRSQPVLEESPSPGHPRVFALLERKVTAELPSARLLRVGEGFGPGRAFVEGSGFTLAFDYDANEGRDHVAIRNRWTLGAVRHLKALAAAGVDLESTGERLATDEGPLACSHVGPSAREIRCVVSPEPDPVPVTLDRPTYLVPPSQRSPTASQIRRVPRISGSTVDVPALSRVLLESSDFEVRGTRLDDEHQALLVTAFEGPPFVGAALCIASAGWLRCAATAVEDLDGVLAGEPDRWLLLGNSSFGALHSGETLLVSVELSGATPIVDILSVGGVSGNRERCELHDGACVWIDAWMVTPRIVGDGCVERRHEGRWSATHVRIGDLWIDEVITPREGGPCVDRFSFGPNGFERSDCGPISETPACETDEPFVHALVRQPFE